MNSKPLTPIANGALQASDKTVYQHRPVQKSRQVKDPETGAWKTELYYISGGLMRMTMRRHKTRRAIKIDLDSKGERRYNIAKDGLEGRPKRRLKKWERKAAQT